MDVANCPVWEQPPIVPRSSSIQYYLGFKAYSKCVAPSRLMNSCSIFLSSCGFNTHCLAIIPTLLYSCACFPFLIFTLQVENPSMPNDEGITPLHNAVCAGHHHIVKFLLDFGVNVNAADSDGWSVPQLVGWQRGARRKDGRSKPFHGSGAQRCRK